MSELAPATLEGWYALHQMFAVEWSALRDHDSDGAAGLQSAAVRLVSDLEAQTTDGWSAAFRLVGGGADIMLIHFRRTLDDIAAAQLLVRHSAVGPLLSLHHDFISVTEAGLYHATAEAAKAAAAGSPEYQRLLDESAAAELGSDHVQIRLFPRVPEGMRYVSFYPMDKRRADPHNWYTLPISERNRLMREHGLTGRRYAGRIFQVITGAVGFDDWEWGVTLFARDPLEFKRIVTEMRYDEVSAKYGEFGEFFTGIRMTPEELGTMLTLPGS